MQLSREAAEVLSGGRPYWIEHADCFAFLDALPADSIDLIVGSPPYENQRQYGELQFKLQGQEWVDWMVLLFTKMVRVCKGLVAMVVGHGKTEDYKWSATPCLLAADLHRAGVVLRTPPIYERNGIFGSGGKDWWRNDYEFVICATKRRQKLPWSNNVATGKPPKWAPGGEASHRLPDGARRNQWGGSKKGGGTRRANGKVQSKDRPSHEYKPPVIANPGYQPPVIANPGNVIQLTYTAEEVLEIISELHDQDPGNVIHCRVGGGNMGSQLAHENEAPYPLELAERFVLSFCPPGGIVYDPFSGSATTMQAAVENRRRGLATDLRASQVELGKRRLGGVTPRLTVPSDEERERALAAKAAKGKGYAHPQGQAPGLFAGLDGGE